MTPTAKLRFVEREITERHWQPHMADITLRRNIRVLQQWWEPDQWNAPGEWRDVPLEKDDE